MREHSAPLNQELWINLTTPKVKRVATVVGLALDIARARQKRSAVRVAEP